MESRSRNNTKLLTTLLELMESYGDIARPRQGAQGRMKADRLWRELEEILNSTGGEAIRSIDKWKKVWVDWKTKIKKKALAMCHEASGTVGGPSSRQTVTALEQMVLVIMGLSALKRGFDSQPSERVIVPPSNRGHVPNSPHTCHRPNSVGFYTSTIYGRFDSNSRLSASGTSSL